MHTLQMLCISSVLSYYEHAYSVCVLFLLARVAALEYPKCVMAERPELTPENIVRWCLLSLTPFQLVDCLWLCCVCAAVLCGESRSAVSQSGEECVLTGGGNL